MSNKNSNGFGSCAPGFRGIYNLAICFFYPHSPTSIRKAIGGGPTEVCPNHVAQDDNTRCHNYELHRQATSQQGTGL